MENIAEKITYLFGAGASADALPVVKNFKEDLKNFKEDLNKTPEFAFDVDDVFYITKQNKNKVKDSLCQSIDWLVKKIEDHASVDTYAKKLSLTGDDGNLKILKAVLTCFFTYLQNKKPFDKRYDTFLASIFSDLHRLPSNVRILSWNYDSQFEIASSQYFSTKNFYSIQQRLSITPNADQLHFGTQIQVDPNKFAIFKLNGTTSYYNQDKINIETVLPDVLHILNDEICSAIVELYYFLTMPSVIHSLISFAWQSNVFTEQVKRAAIESTKDTTRLVCIGYSFPFFNRDTDRAIIRAMTNLKTVYLQARNDDVSDVADRFKAINPQIKNIVQNTDTKQFFLPPEL